MKRALWVFGFAALFSMRLIYANDAPVVDVTQQAQTQAAEPENGPADSGDDSQTPMVNRVSPSNNNAAAPVENAPAVTQVPPISTSHLSSSKRMNRLEQQVQNLIRMNLPEQVSQLQQKVDKLEGQIQEQQHTIANLNQRLSQNAPAKTDNSATNVPPANPAVTKNPANSAQKPMDEAGLYRNAFDLLIKKQYDPAREAFENYLNQYPKGQFLVNAHYWLGEIYLLQKKSQPALEQFQAVVDQFPNSSKVADAKLKIAQILAQTGKIAQARQQLSTIIKSYPGSTAAQLAKIQLQQISPAKKKHEEE